MKKLFLLVLLAGCGSDCDESELYEAIKADARKQLVAPATATFAPLDEAKTYRAERICEIKVKGWVDAQNKMGAFIRADFEGGAIQKTAGDPVTAYAIVKAR